jgi:hypothetical protein
MAPSERRKLAAAIESLQGDRARRAGFSAAVPVDGQAVAIGEPALAQLAGALRDRDAVAVRGVALSKLLLTEPSSPVYRPADPDAVYAAAREALFALVLEEGDGR